MSLVCFSNRVRSFLCRGISGTSNEPNGVDIFNFTKKMTYFFDEKNDIFLWRKNSNNFFREIFMAFLIVGGYR